MSRKDTAVSSRYQPRNAPPSLDLRPAFQIERVDSVEGFLALEGIWRHLQEPVRLSNLGSSFDVLRCVIQTITNQEDEYFGYNRKFCILVVRLEGEVIAIAPLVKVLRNQRIGRVYKAVTSIEFLGHPSMRIYFQFFRDIITDHPSPHLIEAIYDWLRQNEVFDVLHLAFINEDSASFRPGNPYLVSLHPSAVVEIDKFSDFKSYTRLTYSKHLKQNFRTVASRARRDGHDLRVESKRLNATVKPDLDRLTRLWSKGLWYLEGNFDRFRTALSETQNCEVVFVYVNGEAAGYRVYLHYPGGKMQLESFSMYDFRPLGLVSWMIDKAIQTSFDEHLVEHCEGISEGFHNYRFATRRLRILKYVRPGNTLPGRAFGWLIATFPSLLQKMFANANRK